MDLVPRLIATAVVTLAFLLLTDVRVWVLGDHPSRQTNEGQLIRLGLLFLGLFVLSFFIRPGQPIED